ncbi:type 1 glutamine amidotransferase domain-containing protein [Larkinella ripae]
MKPLFNLILAVLVTVFAPGLGVAQAKKVLIVSTNVNTLQNQANGTFLMEIAYPLAVFTTLGMEVDVVTPRGGKAAIYHRGGLPDSLARIQANELFVRKTTHTLAPHQVVASAYAGIFYPGGGGQFYDVVHNDAIARLAAAIYEGGGVVGSAGHGAVSLLNIRLTDGGFLVNQKKITGFPQAISARWLPIDWEAELKKRGATVVLPVTAAEKENGVELYDHRMVSGSYAENAQWVARQMVRLMN